LDYSSGNCPVLRKLVIVAKAARPKAVLLANLEANPAENKTHINIKKRIAFAILFFGWLFDKY